MYEKYVIDLRQVSFDAVMLVEACSDIIAIHVAYVFNCLREFHESYTRIIKVQENLEKKAIN